MKKLARNVFIVSISILLVLVMLFTGCTQTPAQTAPNSISGHVYQSDGKTPIAGAKIDISNNRGMYWRGEISSDSGGSYIFTGLSAGEYIIKVFAEGYFSEYYDGFYLVNQKIENATSIYVTDGDATIVNFTLDTMASISGKVYRADNKKPVEKATVLAYGPHFIPGGARGARTTEDGRYKILNLNSGQSSVVAVADGFIPRYYNGVYVPEQATKVTTVLAEDTSGIDIYLEWGGSISGRVYQPDSLTPDNETGIWYRQVSGVKTPILGGDLPTPSTQKVETLPDGTYHIGGLLSGEYELMAVGMKKPYYVTKVHRISVIQGEETPNTDFVLGLRGSISGHVYYQDGKTPAVGANVGATGWATFHSNAKTDSTGYYLMEQMAPGKYLVLVPNYQYKYDEVSVSAGKETTHNIVLNINPK